MGFEDQAVFWAMTPRIFHIAATARMKRLVEERRERRGIAYDQVALPNARRPISRDDFVGKPPRNARRVGGGKRQTPAEIMNSMDQWRFATAHMKGGPHGR